MVSARINIVAAAVAVSTFVAHVNAHGYMAIPETQFKGTKTSAWVVQIDPPSAFASSDWDGNKEGSVTAWKQVSKTNGVKDLKTLLDGDTSLYGAECGFSNPSGTAQPIPSDGKATFSRAIQHVGPCEIWLDNTKVFSADNCYGDYESGGTSKFPVDYSQCNNGGCKEMRFYWLAFQGIDNKTVWQTYKDCIPLKGGSSSSTSTSSTPASTSSSSKKTSAPATTTSAPSTSTSLEASDNASSNKSDDSKKSKKEKKEKKAKKTKKPKKPKKEKKSKKSESTDSERSVETESWDAEPSKAGSGSNGWGNWGSRMLRA